MSHWWEIAAADHVAVIRPRAVAYYRHSAQDRQENSIPIQREKVRSWAEQNGIDIIKEFEDAGKSGLNAEGRPAFSEMMNEWVKKRNDFAYVICLDVSRWGRFQDIDLSAQYSGECKRNGKPVIYTTIGKPRDDDTFHPIHLHLERYRAAEYSRELSRKVWDGCVKISQQGYWAGGPPPYGLHRLLLDERCEPLHPLKPGQRKSIQNQRVTLVMGDPAEVAVVRRIFYEFVELRYSEFLIAERLNAEKIRPGNGRHWTAGMVVHRLRNEKYRGTIVYNRTSRKLKTPCRPNPPDQWIRTPEAFEGIGRSNAGQRLLDEPGWQDAAADVVFVDSAGDCQQRRRVALPQGRARQVRQRPSFPQRSDANTTPGGRLGFSSAISGPRFRWRMEAALSDKKVEPQL